MSERFVMGLLGKPQSLHFPVEERSMDAEHFRGDGFVLVGFGQGVFDGDFLCGKKMGLQGGALFDAGR